MSKVIPFPRASRPVPPPPDPVAEAMARQLELRSAWLQWWADLLRGGRMSR